MTIRKFFCQDCGYVLHNYTTIHKCIVCTSFNVVEEEEILQ